MGCGSCGSGGCGSKAGAATEGCGGGCKTGGCNRLNVYDWLSNLPASAERDSFNITEVTFKNGGRKGFFRNTHNLNVVTGDLVAVESLSGGYDMGHISLSGELVRLQMRKKRVKLDSPDIPRIIRQANERDIEKWDYAKSLERDTMLKARVIARDLKLNMKIGEVEYQGDGRKATFYYTADGRIDYRDLIRLYAQEFKVKIEMRQIGARQEAGKIGGIGSCGRELCCSTWLTEFKSVTTSAARYQGLSINQTKLSGQCGRLKCCLNYELDTYLDALKAFPKRADRLKVKAGTAELIKTDIFQQKMWYTNPETSSTIPLSIEQVKKILKQNKEGIIPETIGDGVPRQRDESRSGAKAEEYVDLVGQTSIASLERLDRKKKRKMQGNRRRKGGGSKSNTGGKRTPQSNKPRSQKKANPPKQNNSRNKKK